jgi:hypothetical protein
MNDRDIVRIADLVLVKLLARLGQKPHSSQSRSESDLADALTPAEVSQMLRVKLSTLSSWRCKGVSNKPPFVRLSRKVVLYPRIEFNLWMNRQKLVNPDSP